MIITLSPAKSLDESSMAPFPALDLPEFIHQAAIVNQAIAQKTTAELATLQGISSNLAALNYERNQTWRIAAHESVEKPAIALFKGDVYLGLAVEDWTIEDALFAQQYVRLLSGLYGVVRPLDKIQPYRLEMGTSLPVGAASNLVQYWQELVTQSLQAHPDPVLLDLASQEYSKVVHKKKLQKRVITVDFKEYKNGQYKVLSFFAKRARGSMARWVVKNRLVNPGLLVDFKEDGYRYEPGMSSEDHLVFLRG
jgi:uncharacterized protein